MRINEYSHNLPNNQDIYKYIEIVIMDLKNKSNQKKSKTKQIHINTHDDAKLIKTNEQKTKQLEQIELEREKTKQLELIREIKKLELKLKNNKKYKHTKKYIDLSSILDSDNEETHNDNYDTISMQSSKSITTIDHYE